MKGSFEMEYLLDDAPNAVCTLRIGQNANCFTNEQERHLPIKSVGVQDARKVVLKQVKLFALFIQRIALRKVNHKNKTRQSNDPCTDILGRLELLLMNGDFYKNSRRSVA